MKNARLKKVLVSQTCGAEMQEGVMALAEGAVDSERERLSLLAHLADCPSCRHLFEDFFLASGDGDGRNAEAGSEGAFDSIAVKIGRNGIIPLAGDMPVHREAMVLAGGELPAAEYKAGLGSREILLRIVKGKETCSIEVENAGAAERMYLIGGADYRYAPAVDGTVLFERLGPGRYLLSRDLKSFLLIIIDG